MEAHAENYVEGDEGKAEFSQLRADAKRASQIAEIYDLLQPDTFEPH